MVRSSAYLSLIALGACSFPGAGAGSPPGDAPMLVDGPTSSERDGPVSSKKRKKRITVDPAKVTGNHTGFPVWIALTDADISKRAQGNGSDLHFTKPDGSLLAYQLQRWDRASGRLEAWVRVDLDDTAPTLIDLHYGDPDAAHPPSGPMTFNNSFAAVWHLEDALTNATIVDATAQRNGQAQGGLDANDRAAAKLGSGVDFNAANARISFTNPLSGNGPHTISAWVSQRTATDYDSILTVGNSQQNQSRWFHSHYLANVGVGFYTNDFPDVGTNIDSAGLVLLHWVYEGENLTSRVYRDGVQVGTLVHQAGINTQGNNGFLGYAPNQWGPGGNTPCTLNGILDEVRIATVARTAGWIATEFANQGAPATFYSVGPEETP